MKGFQILRVKGREVLDSRGNPTVEAEVITPWTRATGITPSGASTGIHEAVELRDNDRRYGGKGVLRAVENINGPVSKVLTGLDVRDQKNIDRNLIDIDGTPNKSDIGANSTTAVSLACANAGAKVKRVPLHEHLSKGSRVLPVPMFNILNGGMHAGNDLSIQEFMVVPTGAESFREALRMGTEVYHQLKVLLKNEFGNGAINVGDEGGFAPPLQKTEDSLELISDAIQRAGYEAGADVYVAIDSAASEFYRDGDYIIDGRTLSPEELLDYYESLYERFCLISMEDPVEEESIETMARLTDRMGEDVQLVGDDMFVTNPDRIKIAIQKGAGNATLLKVNQVGTVSETIQAAEVSINAGYNSVVSHRSGETEDTSIADIAVALQCGQIKAGAPARGERTAKYNRLLRIEEMLGNGALFPGERAFRERPYLP